MSTSPDDRTAPDPADLRVGYTAGLLEHELPATPLEAFRAWFLAAVEAGVAEPNAMALATAQPTGEQAAPSVRTVLLKAIDARGLSFYTNHFSRKGRELAASPWAAAVFPWFAMHRQVTVSGPVARLGRDEAEAYFRTRPYGSRLGAWASAQSTTIASREALEAAFADAAERYPDTGSPDDVPLPDFWGGYLLMPTSVELWAGRPSRLHDRLCFERRDGGAPVVGDGGARLDDAALWTVRRLAP